MEKENQPEPQNVQIKKEFKLRSSLKRSVRNISELKDDSMESPDETVGGLRRRVSFAASSTVKPFVNDPVQNTIWDNTYEEIVDHTDSNNTLSTASSVIGTVQSSKEIKIVMSCQETPNDQGKKRKCVMSKTITEVVDMNYTCQQHKVNLQVTDTNKTVNGSNINRTIYPDIGMDFTCVFPEKQDANFETRANMKEKSVNTDMEFTCLFPAQEDVNSTSIIKEQSKFLNEDMSLTCVFPGNKELNIDNSGDGMTTHPNADMSLTCVFPASTLVNTENNAKQTTNISKNMSLPCVIRSGDVTTQNLSSNRNLVCVSTNTEHHVSKDDSIEKMCSIVTNEKLIADESNLSILEEGFSLGSINLQQDASRGSKTTSALLYFSDGFGSTQKPSFFSNTSIYNTHQLLESRSFHVSDISVEKPMNKSADLISINKCLESSIGSNKDANRILNNVEMKIYHPSRFTAITMQKCKDTLNYAKDVCDKFRAYLREFVPTKHHVSKLEKNVKRLSLLRASSASSVSLSNESDEDLQDAEMDNELVVVSKHQQIMEVFQNTDVIYLKLISFQDNGYTFSTYFSAVKIAVTIHPDDGRVVEVKVKSQLNPNPRNSIFFMQNAFLVKHIMNKMQMSNLMLSLGICFDMLSLLHQVQMIMEKCIDFVYDFVKAQREFKTLKMDSDGVVQFNIMHTNPPIFWTMQFQMSSPETILQDSLKVSSKWSPINKTHFESIFLNVQPGTDCIKQVAIDVFEFFKRTELRKLKCNN
uniref:Knl1 C-terminal RWD domain-containing protein n=1 Tax=Dendroctonus ponderosae TaxID=77166 RepID=A0AAR5PTT2_DENPD